MSTDPSIPRPSAAQAASTPRGVEVSVATYRESDETPVLELLTRAFGRWPTALDADPRDFFRWKHEGSPFGPSVRLVARVGGEAVGFLALMPWRLSFAGTIHETFRGVDIAVAPDRQGLGIAGALIEASRNSHADATALAWSNPNERSRSVLWKAGRRRVDGLPTFVGLGMPPGKLPGRLLGSRAPAPPEGADPLLASLLADDVLLGRLVAPRPTEGIATARDAAYLRWRYGGPGGYRAVRAEDPGAGAGIAIFRVQAHGRFSLARVCEVLTEADDPRSARRLLGRVREAARTDLLLTAAPASGTALRGGLLRSNRTALIAANPLHGDLRPDPTQAAAWALSLGDLELI